MVTRNLKRLLVAVVAFIVHSILQFVGWAYANRPDLDWLWPIMSFPMFAITPESVSTRFFWLIFLANSGVWAVVVVSVLDRVRKRARP